MEDSRYKKLMEDLGMTDSCSLKVELEQLVNEASHKIHKDNEFYKLFYDENRVSILQYDNLRIHFNKMVRDVLGEDYYNIGMDVCQSDRQCCEDITRKLKKQSIVRKFLQYFKN